MAWTPQSTGALFALAVLASALALRDATVPRRSLEVNAMWSITPARSPGSRASETCRIGRPPA